MPLLQKLATRPHPEKYQSNSHTPQTVFMIRLNIIFTFIIRFSNWSFPQVSSVKTLCTTLLSVIRAKCPAQICYTKITNLVQFTTHVRKILPSTSIHFAPREFRSRVVLLSRSSSLFMQAVAFKMRATNTTHAPTFLF